MVFKELNETEAGTLQTNYAFDYSLFSHFLRDLGLKRKTVIQAMSIPPSTWDNWQSTKVIPVKRLIELCNITRVPLSYFIIADDEESEVVSSQISEEEWIPVEFQPYKFGDYITKGRGNTIDDACAELGFFPSYFYRNYHNSEVSTLPIDAFLKHCNMLRVWPGTWLIDDNDPIAVLDGFEIVNFSGNPKIMRLNRLRNKFRAVSKENKELRAELERLRNKLAEKHTYITMAAEVED